MMRTGIMMDIETLGLDDNAVIVQLHFAAFDLDDPESTVSHFGSALPLAPQLRMKREVEGPTLLWWLRESYDALALFLKPELEGNRDDLYSFLQASATWLASHAAQSSEIEVWQMGSGFDTRITKSLFNEFDIEWPLHYRTVRDLRTLVAESGIDKDSIPQVPGYVKHDARFDCLQQIRWYFAARTALGRAK